MVNRSDLIHDTFAKQAQAIFPTIPYLAPAGFDRASGILTRPLLPPPADWAGELEVLRIDGLRKIDEHAFFHRASRTLVLAGLLFHFPEDARGWTRFFVRRFMRLPRLLGISALFRLMIRDQEAFARSMRTLLEWDFAQIVVAHGEPIMNDAKSIFAQALRDRGIALEGLEIQRARAIASA